MMSNLTPPCAHWKLWLGPEIEGASDLGKLTLFVRHATAEAILAALLAYPAVSRVWFCKEYFSGRSRADVLRTIESLGGLRVCSEIDYSNLAEFGWLRGWSVFYVKFPYALEEGDHICVGSAFSDEAFRIGDGNKVKPSQYLGDVFLA